MKVEIINSEKDEAEISINNITVAELLRVYLNQGGIDFAAWKREHPSKPAIMKIKSSGKSIIKAVSGAVDSIKKDCDTILHALKK